MDRFITTTPNNSSKRRLKGTAGNTLMVIQLDCRTGGLTGAPKNKFLYEVQPDIVLLQETWFSGKNTTHFHGYSMVNRNRSRTYKTTGGRVAILIRGSAGINYTPLPDLTAPDNISVEISPP